MASKYLERNGMVKADRGCDFVMKGPPLFHMPAVFTFCFAFPVVAPEMKKDMGYNKIKTHQE